MNRLVIAAALLATIAVYSVALDAPFTYDDRVEVVGNHTIRSLGEMGAIVGYNPSRPLLIATYAMNWALGGADPFGYHVLSLAIHLANVVLAWRFLARLIDEDRAAVAAALWAVHPLATESVTYITGRSDSLCATAWLIALIGWIDFRRGVRGPLLAFVGTAAAFGVKELAVGIPLAMVALSHFVIRERIPLRSLVPVGVIAAAAVATRLGVWGWPVPEVPRDALTQACAQAEAWFVYLRLWLVPWGQSILHDHRAEVGPVGLAMLVSVAVGVVAAGWRGGIAGTFTAIAVGWLLPASILPLKEVLAEHRSYLAGLALLAALAAAIPRVRSLLVVAPLLAGLTWNRNQTWSDEVALWAEAAERNPTSRDAAYGHAEALRFAEQWQRAEVAYHAVLALSPGDDDALVGLGVTEMRQVRPEDAEATWLRALVANPKNCAAHNNLARLHLDRDAIRPALTEFASTLYWCPDDITALRELGRLNDHMGDFRRARDFYTRYLELAPDGPERRDIEAARERIAP